MYWCVEGWEGFGRRVVVFEEVVVWVVKRPAASTRGLFAWVGVGVGVGLWPLVFGLWALGFGLWASLSFFF
jgi:hypothetical protein